MKPNANIQGKPSIDWIKGDMFPIDMPAHPDALREGGVEFLTRAFRITGALGQDNSVTAITRAEDCPRGSTGKKLFLELEYSRPSPDLHSRLFVKFSRDFDNALRDNQRFEMECEARFAALSRAENFPINVARCYFSDFHSASGTGVMITQAIEYGENGIEPHYDKCADWEVPDLLNHYKAILATNARLAGAHGAGLLSKDIYQYFEYDKNTAINQDSIPFDNQSLQKKIDRYVQFCSDFSYLLPENIRSPGFHARLRREMPLFLAHQHTIRNWLYSGNGRIIFAHWNANIDNAWFWRDNQEQLRCGFIDWGRVGQMNIASAIWGTLSGAPTLIWDDHLDELLTLFSASYSDAGGAHISPASIRLQMDMLIGLLGIRWLLDSAPLFRRSVEDVGPLTGPRDPWLRENEFARCQLHMLTVFMNLWETHDMAAQLETVLSTESHAPAPQA